MVSNEENVVVIDGVKIPQYMLETERELFKIIQEDDWFSLVNETEAGEYEYWYLAKDKESLEGYCQEMNRNMINFRAKYRMMSMVREEKQREFSLSTIDSDGNYGFFGYTE